MNFLPLTPPGQTPLRVLTIAGSDSGGGAGIQADLRTCALLGVHALVAVTAVTVQNSVGVKGFHEIPLDVISGQIEAVASDIGVQAAKTGMLASAAIIETVAQTWQGQGLAGTVPLVVDPVCASMHGDPLLHPSARWIRSSGNCFHWPRWSPRTSTRSGCWWTSRSSIRTRSARRHGRCTRSARSGCWSRAATCGPHRTARICCSTAPNSMSSTHRAYRTGNDHGAGDTLAAATACALAHGYSVPDAVAFGKRWVTECIRAAYPLGHGHGPVSALFRLYMNLDAIAGMAHEPKGTPSGVVVLTHGAGGSRSSPLLTQICDEWARRGWLAVRYNLPYRRRRPKGPPSGSAATDRAGIVEAVAVARTLAGGPVIAGGHSYGGRQTSMAVAEGLAVGRL